MKTLTLKAITQEVGAIYRPGDPIPEKIRSRVGKPELYDLAGEHLDLLRKGAAWFLEPIHRHQPRTSAVIDRAKIDWILTETWFEGFPGDGELLSLRLFLGLDDRYIAVRPHMSPGPEAGDEFISRERYNALPEPLAEAWYSRAEGFQAADECSVSPWVHPVLPAGIGLWAVADAEMEAAGIAKPQVRKLIAAMKRRSRQPTGPTKYRFRVLIDTRDYMSESDDFDWIIIDEDVADSALFHLHSKEPTRLGVLLDPVNTLDAYVAWALDGGAGRFDFQPRSETIIGA